MDFNDSRLWYGIVGMIGILLVILALPPKP
jgi:hypothetical protein